MLDITVPFFLSLYVIIGMVFMFADYGRRHPVSRYHATAGYAFIFLFWPMILFFAIRIMAISSIRVLAAKLQSKSFR